MSSSASDRSTSFPHVAVAELASRRTADLREAPRQESPDLHVAALFADAQDEALAESVSAFLADVNVPLALRLIPASLARGGSVGRIGLPREATVIMSEQRVVIGASVGADPLAPVSRLWRGLQRRADVLADVQQCTTLAGSPAALAGVERDVLLLAQRGVERLSSRSGATADSAEHWSRARQTAELALRLAVAEKRVPLLVLPVGRATSAQRLFTDAIERQARLHRLQAPRVVKAGLLSALLCGEGGRERWLVASVMPMDELSALAREAIGDAGPWPVQSLGATATFYDMPAGFGAADDPVPMLLVMVQLLQRNGHGDHARTLLQAVTTTSAAVARMREELGTAMPVPHDAFLRGVRANWGRSAAVPPVRERRQSPRLVPATPPYRPRIDMQSPASGSNPSVEAAV